MAITCAVYFVYTLLFGPALTARVQYVPICTAHPLRPRDAQETQKAVTTQSGERQANPQRESYVSQVHSHTTFKCTIIIIYGPSIAPSRTPLFGYPLITMAVLPRYHTPTSLTAQYPYSNYQTIRLSPVQPSGITLTRLFGCPQCNHPVLPSSISRAL